MESTSGPHSGNPAPWEYSENQDRLAQPAILLVEDDRDIREMLILLLDMAGFTVMACETAEAGLNALREQDFDLILTDYALPRQSGAWLLQNAEAEGLIDGTPVLIVTAHPHIEGVAKRYEVIPKPFDLDDLIERVRYRVEGEGPRRRRAGNVPPPGDDGRQPGDPGCPSPVELILYVSARSPRSEEAVRVIENVLKRFSSSRVKLTVERATGTTPILARKTAGPRTFILGHITNPDLLLELLADCDLEES